MVNGIFWPAVFQGDEDNIRKAPYGSWLVRDWNYNATSLTGASFFGSDGNLVSTLFSSTNPGGPWYDFGYMDPKGPEFTPKIDVKPTKVMQSRWAARFDYTGQSETIGATLMESNDVVEAVLNNAALTPSLQPIGTVGYNYANPVDWDLKWRQCLFIAIDNKFGEAIITLRIYPKVLFGDFGKTNWNIDDPTDYPVKAFAIPDEFTTPPDGVNVGAPRWVLRDGPAWRVQGQSNFQIQIPVATAVTGLKASIVFNTPAGLIVPVTYTGLKQTGGSGAFTSVTLQNNTGTVSGNQTTVQATGLTATTQYAFEVTATDSNSPTPTVITTAASNTITSTSS